MTIALKPDHVAEIRARYAAGGVTLKQLGREFGVGYTQIQKIVRGTRWPERSPIMDQMPPPERAWTPAEIEYLSDHRDDPISEQAAALHRSPTAVKVQRSRLPSHPSTGWGGFFVR